MKVIVFILLLTSVTAFSQVEIDRSSLSSGGGAAKVGAMKVVYTVGELAVQEVDAGTLHLSEGFIGKNLKSVATRIKNYSPLKGIRVFPNPVHDMLFVNLPKKSDYQIYLFEMNGKMLFSKKVSGMNTQINMGSYKTAIYLILITDVKNKKKQIVKVEKQ